MIKIKVKSTTPVAIKASRCKSVAYPISSTMFEVKVRTPFKIPVGILAWFPATKITAIVSPIARPSPSTIAATIPDFAAGSTAKNTLRS